MGATSSFMTPEEASLEEEFLSQGYVIREVEDREGLDTIRNTVVELACRHLDRSLPEDPAAFMNYIHELVKVDELNDLRMFIYREMNAHAWMRPTYFGLARRTLQSLVGNELAMQNRVNASIQLPHDDSSLLTIHSDAYGGDSPFQVVEWLPLVDVEGTKSMFLLPPERHREIVPKLHEYGDGGMQRVYEDVKDDLKWLTVPYGSVLIFTPNLLHGNTLNVTDQTRWSMNCRLKGLFTPYTSYEKQIGNYYMPITPRTVSRIGMDHQVPTNFDD